MLISVNKMYVYKIVILLLMHAFAKNFGHTQSLFFMIYRDCIENILSIIFHIIINKTMKKLLLWAIILVICYQQITLLSNLPIEILRNAQLQRHNLYRVKHGCPPLTLNSTLNTIAQNYSQYLGSQVHSLVHSAVDDYGQNLYWSWGSPTVSYSEGEASSSWYSQQSNYTYGKFPPPDQTGHFTAMIWKSVTSVGFGYYKVAEDGGQGVYVVANYYPAPNIFYQEQYASNIPRPKQNAAPVSQEKTTDIVPPINPVESANNQTSDAGSNDTITNGSDDANFTDELDVKDNNGSKGQLKDNTNN